MSAVQRARGYLVPDEVDREIAYSKQDFTGHVKKAAILWEQWDGTEDLFFEKIIELILQT